MSIDVWSVSFIEPSRAFSSRVRARGTSHRPSVRIASRAYRGAGFDGFRGGVKFGFRHHGRRHCVPRSSRGDGRVSIMARTGRRSVTTHVVAVAFALACVARGVDARAGGDEGALKVMINHHHQLAARARGAFGDGNATVEPSPPLAPMSTSPPPPPASPPAPLAPATGVSPPATKRAANGVAVLVFSALSVACALGACYVALFYDEHSASGDNDSDEGRSTSLREELGDFWRYARTHVAGATADGIVRVQRLTHRDEGGDESWRRLSDTNPFVRWIKRHVGDAEDEGETLIDEHDDDYYDMMSDHEAYADFSEYLTSEAHPGTPRTLDEAESSNSAFVRLPPSRAPSILDNL